MDWIASYSGRRLDGTCSESEDDDPFPKHMEPEGSVNIAPFIPTETRTVVSALTLAGCSASDRVVDLGCGDGRFCCAAVQQFGAEHAVGVELDEALVEIATEHASKCGVTSRTTFLTADLLSADVAALCPGYPQKKFTLAVMFLLAEAEERFMEVAQKLADSGARLLVIAFKLEPIWGLTLAAQDGPVYLYVK